MRRSAAPSHGGGRAMLHRPLHPTQPKQQATLPNQPQQPVQRKPDERAVLPPAAQPHLQASSRSEQPKTSAGGPRPGVFRAPVRAGGTAAQPAGVPGPGKFRAPVRAGATAAQPTGLAAATSPATSHYYTVMYTKDVKKKAKVWQDGVLAHAGKKLVLMAIEDGKQVAATRFREPEQPLCDGEELDAFGRYLVEIVSTVAESEFSSGRIFLGTAPQPALSASAESASSCAMRSANLGKFRPVGQGAAVVAANPAVLRALHNPEAPNALVLDPGQEGVRAPVVVDPVLARELRPHQRDGVKFMFSCVTGRSDPTRMGCILADEMGLGKSLQCIALAWTLLKQGGRRGGPAIKKACVVCPSSLVSNWEKEFRKWLGRERISTLAVDPTLENIAARIDAFHTDKMHHVIIISYELYRKYAVSLNKSSTIDLLLCDEGHRLKSSGTSKTIAALAAAPTKRRVIITGTPVQNDLEEFYCMCDFVNPSCLGALALFRHIYATPILASRDAAASNEKSYIGQQRSDELNKLTQSFMLRRDASINKVRDTELVFHCVIPSRWTIVVPLAAVLIAV